MQWKPLKQIPSLVLLALTFLMIPGCDDTFLTEEGGDFELPPLPSTDEYLSSVEGAGAEALYVDDRFPQGVAMAPAVLGATQYIDGGSLVLQVTPQEDAIALYIAVQSTDSGYYRVGLPGAQATSAHHSPPQMSLKDNAKAGLPKLTAATSATAARAPGNDYIITITPADDAPIANFRVMITEYNGTVVSTPAVHTAFVNATAQGSGLLQMSLNWTHPVDMDLHVETPEGEDIFYASRSGSQGGVLDLDSNAACSIDGINNENITWISAQPTAGTYRVRVNLWSACDQEGPFPYVVNVAVGGESTFLSGSLSLGDELAGGAFEGTLITEVVVAAPAP